MQLKTILPASRLKGSVVVPGDKSITHRALLLGAISSGTTRIFSFSRGKDCLSTLNCLKQLGIDIRLSPGSDPHLTIQGKGPDGLAAPASILDAGNSGTTLRLLSGILSGQAFPSRITGDSSLKRRPMDRILLPLRRMGAEISSLDGSGKAPLSIRPSVLTGIRYTLPVASAQVKSAVLLAGLYAKGKTSICESIPARDHTERMLSAFGGNISTKKGPKGGLITTLVPSVPLLGRDVPVPGDISSAAYWIGAALLLPGSRLFLPRVGINPTRTGFLTVCRRMGGDLTFSRTQTFLGEPCADLLIRHSLLKGTVVSPEEIPSLIDELPMLAVLAAFARGETILRGIGELRFKESNRILSIVSNLRAMGVSVSFTEEEICIHGKQHPSGAAFSSYKDHRIAMAFAIAALAAATPSTLDDWECCSISYPGFFREIERLQDL